VTTHGKRISLLTRYEAGWAPGNREEMLAKNVPPPAKTPPSKYKKIKNIYHCGVVEVFLIKYTHVQKTIYQFSE
jgi:hypothetical protein